MITPTLFQNLLWAWLLLALCICILLFFITAPYGRHTTGGWGATMDNKLAWLVMEAPASLLFAVFFFFGSQPKTLTLWLFFGLWQAHYIHRAFIYPLRLRSGVKSMPILIASFAFIFNTINVFFNGYYLFSLAEGYTNAWLTDPRFVIGVLFFVVGFILNRHADHTLRHLRQPGETEYKIPYGGLYRWVSCPNYLGEIIEWLGWALATYSLPGLAFALWTIANLAPRAYANHQWYREHFSAYPQARKALIPKVW